MNNNDNSMLQVKGVTTCRKEKRKFSPLKEQPSRHFFITTILSIDLLLVRRTSCSIAWWGETRPFDRELYTTEVNSPTIVVFNSHVDKKQPNC